MPDVIGFADYVAFEGPFCRDLLQRASVGVPGSMAVFPYPNTLSKVRNLAVLDPGDLVIYRAVGGEIAGIVDPLLGDQVKSSRLVAHPPAWRLRAPKKAHADFREESLRLLHELGTVAQTDLTRYFESIGLHELELFLVSSGCRDEAVTLVSKFLSIWQRRYGLRGLPIGPEASAVLGNGFLHPVDEMVSGHGIRHLRWMDDMNLFARDESACEAHLRLVDTQLRVQRLSRSAEKTFILSGAEAEARIQDGTLASLAVVLSNDRSRGVEQARALFDEEIRGKPDAHPGRFRFVVKTLGHEGDPYAARALLEEPEVFNLDPRVAADYVAETALDDARIVDMLFQAVEEPPSERRDARRLHLIRAASTRPWGTGEGNLLLSVGLNASERPPVRAWAMMAAGGTPALDPTLAEGVALNESEIMTARAAAATLRAPTAAVSRFASKLETSRPSLRFTARWINML